MSSEPKQASRAGRDLPAAFTVGAILVAALLASLFFYKVAFVGLLIIIATLAVLEFTKALAIDKIQVPIIPVLAGGWALLIGAYVGGSDTISVGIALTTLGIFVLRFLEGIDGFVRDVSAGVLTLVYIPVLGSFAVLMVAEVDGPWRIVTFVAVTVMSDTGGYVAGVLFGKHPMAPGISPKKSWEGFAGSMFASIVVAIGLVIVVFDEAWWIGLILGVAVVIVATLGDLTESLIKRDLGIKDMGTLLPGHGGIMDRIDSLLAVAPVAWLIMHLLLPVS